MQNNRLFIGNLSYDWTIDDLKQALTSIFSDYGQVTDVRIPTDFETGKHRAIAFVTMETAEIASKAKDELNGILFGPEGDQAPNARQLKIDFARPKTQNSGGGRDSYSNNKRGGNSYGNNNSGYGNDDGYNRYN